MRKREIALGNTECAIASLLPTIGTTHLIPQWDCLSEFTNTEIAPNATQQLDLKPVQSPTFTGEIATPQRPKPTFFFDWGIGRTCFTLSSPSWLSMFYNRQNIKFHSEEISHYVN
uniref:Uncharacterized protein n=1 Tax=Caenorhabditis tropicalis TaxID=1561998 RepID=A0A1I7U143_9PELO